MTLLAFKIRNQELDKVTQIDADVLYKKARKINKQFFDFPRWIEEEVMKIYLQQKYQKMNKALADD